MKKKKWFLGVGNERGNVQWVDRAGFASIFLVSAVLVFLLLLFFNDVIFRGKTLKSSVIISQALNSGPYRQHDNKLSYIPYTDVTPAVLEEPYLAFKKNTFALGTFPLWNPHQACGMPFFAGGQSAVLFPLTAFLYLLPPKYAWDFYIILAIFLAGLLTFYFMRTLGYGTSPSLFAGIAYMFSGPVITWMVNVTTNTTILIPLLLIAIEKFVRDRCLKRTIFLSFAVGLVLLSGHPEHIFFTFLSASIYFILRWFLSISERADKVKVLKSFCIALVLGFLLASIFIFPFLEYMSNSWTSHSGKIGLTMEEDRARAITIIIPYLFQKVLVNLKGERAGWYGGYIGVMVFLLALLGLFKKDKDKNNIIFGCMALFVILKCYGVWVVNWIGYLPIFDKMRYSLHYTQDFAFAMAILAGIATS